LYLFYFFAALAIWLGVLSLRGGFRYRAYVRREIAKPLADFKPFVSIIAPGRGVDEGLAENIRSLLHQNYPSYEILFVSDRAEDPCLKTIQDVIEAEAGSGQVRTRSLVSGPATDSGQKVHNLRVASDQISRQCEVLVFVDTDARPSPDWLCQLVAPLADESLGATTGYRWFIPEKGSTASRVRSVWNASVASALGASREKNFCWGGSTAIRRATFERLNVADRWRGSVSDDFTLTRVLHEAKLPIYFSAHCLVPSVGDCDAHELLEFSTRQIKITRAYAPHLWQHVFLGSLIFCLVFFGGWTLVFARIALGLPFSVPLILLCHYRRALRKDLPGQILLWPLASLLYLYNAIAATFSRRIEWRGITYELKSPTEAVIISRDRRNSSN
jgi:glycosyltransferase involved in cell wall biosynthesis